MCPCNSDLIYWNKIDLIQAFIVYRKVVTLPSIVPHLSIVSRNIVIGCVKFDQRMTLIEPACFTLNTPKILILILNHHVTSQVATVGHKNLIAELQEAHDSSYLANIADLIGVTLAFASAERSLVFLLFRVHSL
jgi:hypothetical protein